MKKKTRLHLIILILTVLGIFFTVLTTVLVVRSSKKETSEQVEIYSEYRDNNYYSALMNDPVDTSYLDYTTETDSDGQYIKITGFKVDAAISYALANQDTLGIKIESSDTFKDHKAAAVMFSKFLDIPSSFEITTGSVQKPVPVKEIDFDALYDGSDNSSATAASFITGIRIPTSVEKISENAFHAFGSIQYFESPFIGISRGSSARYLNWYNSGAQGSNAPKSYPFVSMFYKNGMSAIIGYKYIKDAENNILINFESSSSEYSVQPGSAEWYEINEGDKKSYDYPGDLTKIVISDEEGIGNHALFNLNSVTEIEISSSSTFLQANAFNIGEYAISNCANLQHVKLPISSNVNLSKAEGLFQNDQELLEVRLPGNLSIPQSCFAECTKLHTVHIPTSIETIGMMAFQNCQALSNFEIYGVDVYDPDNEPSLQYTNGEIHLPGSIKKIYREAFKNCYLFKQVYIGTSLTFMGYNVFNGCKNIEAMVLPFVGANRGESHTADLSSNEDGYNYHCNFGYIFGKDSYSGGKDCIQANKEGSQTFFISNKLTNLQITDETVISIGAFQNMTMLTDLVINDTVTNIASGATSGCTNIEKLTIPYCGVTEGSGGALGTIYGVSNANLPSKLYSVTLTHAYTVYSGSFHNCVHLTTVTFGKYTKWTQTNIFYNTPMLTNLTIPFVGAHRGYFYDTYSHSYGHSVWVDDHNVGYRWWWWRDINIRDAFEWIFSTSHSNDTTRNMSQYYKYYEYSYTRYIPNHLTSITITDDWGISGLAFENLTSVTSLNIQSASHISEGACKGMTNLTELHLPFIGYNANSTGVDGKERVLGYIFGNYDNSLTYTNESSYGYNVPKKLKTVSITGAIPAISSYAFYNLPNLESVIINENSSIVRLGSYAFANDTKLSTVTIPNATYKTVGEHAFENCKNIINIKAVVPFDNLTTIGAYAFAGTGVGGSAIDKNNVLQDYTIDFKNSILTSIGAHAFENCVNIRSIDLKTNLTVGDYAFAGCEQLSSVKLANSISKYMFMNCYSITEINISAFDTIPEGIFYGCENLLYSYNNSTGLKYNENTKSIGANAFYGCESLDKFILYPATTSIGKGAFALCTGLKNMTIPRETKTIAAGAWNDCDDNFYFWVYDVEEDWPTTWVDNWNCGFPVYVIGQTVESDFTYEYDIAHKGYFITGTEEGVVLQGRVSLPKKFLGLPILGIKYDATTAGLHLIKEQTGITSVIIPEQYYYIEQGAFATGKRVDVYFEASRDKILSYYNDDSIKNFTKMWEPTPSWRYDDESQTWSPEEALDDGDGGIISYGIIFYGESWEYGTTKATSTIPFYKASKLTFIYGFEQNDIEYTGSEIKPTEVLHIYLTDTVLVGNDTENNDRDMMIYASLINTDFDKFVTDNNIDFDPATDLFNYSYKNNIQAGSNAQITATVNTTNLSDYLSILDMMKWNRIYITGSNTYTFTIAKKVISLYVHHYDNNNPINSYIESEYTGKAWTNSVWDSTNVTGLFAEFKSVYPNKTRLEGTLATTGVNVGEYSASYTTVAGTDQFKWSVSPKIYRDNVDITKNFDFYLYLTVKIIPKKVSVQWTNYANQDTNPKTNDLNQVYYEYRYDGARVVKPSAIPVYYNPITNELGEEIKDNQCKIITVNITQNDPLYQIDELGNVTVLDRFPSDTLHRCIAYLDPQANVYGNYLFVDDQGLPLEYDSDGIKLYDTKIETVAKEQIDDYYQGTYYECISMNYMIINGLITLKYDVDYTIPSNVDLWEKEFTEADVSGLGLNSKFRMTFRSTDDKIGSHSLSAGTIEVVPSLSVISPEDKMDYHIYRLKSDNTLLDEINYYDFPDTTQNKSVIVNILYNNFTINYYISQYDSAHKDDDPCLIDYIKTGTTISVSPDPNSATQDPNKPENTKISFTFPVEGHYYLFHVGAKEYEETPEILVGYNQSYLTNDGTHYKDGGQLFREANKEYLFEAYISARHFNLYPYTISLNTIKSDVIIAENHNKVYDREVYDVKDYIIKYDTYYYEVNPLYLTQKDLLDSDAYKPVYYMKNNKGVYEPIDNPPSKVGSYKVEVNLPESNYFNAFSDTIYFQITQKPITLNLTGEIDEYTQIIQTYDQDGVKYGYKLYDEYHQTFTPDTDKLSALGYLLGEVKDDSETIIYHKDEFVGEFITTSSKPGTYDVNSIKWTTDFHIYSEDGYDNTENYKIEVIGEFRILPLKFTCDGENEGIEAHEYYGNLPAVQDPSREYHINHGAITFDGNVYYPYVVAMPAAGRTDDVKVYYSLTPLDETNYQTGSLVPYYDNEPTDEVITVYYYVYCDNYEPMSGDLYFEIIRKRMQIQLQGAYNTTTSTWEDIREYEDGQIQEFEVVVLDPTFGTLVEYSYSKDLGQTWSPWSVQPPYIDDVEGLMYVKYRITDDSNHYYTEYSYDKIDENEMTYVIFQVKEPGELISDDYNITIENWNEVYDGTAHSPSVSVSLKSGSSAADKSGSMKTFYIENYVQGEQNDWIEGLPSATDAGTYNYYLKIYIPGYKSYIIESLPGTNTKFGIYISKKPFEGLGISTYSEKYDGKYHKLEVVSANYSEEEVNVYDENNELTGKKTVYYYTDPDNGHKEEITLSYTSNTNVVAANSGWLDDLSYKDAGKYNFYIKVSSKNYEDCILGYGEDGKLFAPSFAGMQGMDFCSNVDDDSYVEIIKLPAAEITVQYTETDFEYTKFDPSGFKIKTIYGDNEYVHDGRRRYYYWETIYDEDTQTYVPNFAKRVGTPTELGRYVLMVQFLETKNCEAITLGTDNNSDPSKLVYFNIVPMTVEVKWTESYYYDGQEYSPNVYADPEVVTIGINAKDGGPIERSAVGTYEYYVYIDPADEHYVLDKSEITMSITKRKITLTIEDKKEIDNKIYHRSNDPDIDYENSDIEYKEWDQPLILISGDDVKHKLIITIKTSTYVRDIYKTLSATSGLSTRYAVLTWKIVAMDPVMEPVLDANGDPMLDEDGNAIKKQKKINGVLQWEYRRDADGKLDETPSEYYDVDIDAIIKIVYKSIDVSSLLDTTVPYDGYEHTLDVFKNGKPAALANADILLYNDDGEYQSNPSYYTNQGDYPYHIVVKKNGYEDTKVDVYLHITKATLLPEIDYLSGADSVYDGTEHTISYDLYVRNLSLDSGKTELKSTAIAENYPDHINDENYYHIRYYKSTDLTRNEVKGIYTNFVKTNVLYTKYALTSMVDAGTYYAVIYYKETDNWNKLVHIEEITIYPRPLGITFNEAIFKTKEYDGKPITILLSGKTKMNTPLVTINTDDLVDGHTIDTSEEAMKNYIIQTNSSDVKRKNQTTANPKGEVRGYYYYEFEFKHIVIIDEYNKDAEVLSSNYVPYVYGNVDVIITPAYLTDLNYKVTNNTATYTGDPIGPNVYCESDGEIKYRYIELDEDDVPVIQGYDSSSNPIVEVDGLPVNAGRYQVLVDVEEGMNYYASSQYNPKTGSSIGTKTAIVTILQVEVTVDWSDLNLTFNFLEQTAKATVTAKNGDVYNLEVFYYKDSLDENGDPIIVYGFTNVGKYVAYARFDDNTSEYNSNAMNKNFYLLDAYADFEITPIELTINIGTETKYLNGGTYWNKEISESMITNFPSAYLELVPTTSDVPYIRTKNALAGVYNSIDSFSLQFALRLKSTGEFVTESVKFKVNGKITVKYNEIPHSVKNVKKVYKGSEYLVLQDLKALVVSLPENYTGGVTYSFYYEVEKADGTIYKSSNFNTDFGVEDVAVYLVHYTITPMGTGYEITTGTFEIEIYEADANVPINTKDGNVDLLNPDYSGKPFDPTKVVNQTVTSFNGTASEYYYDYYEYTSTSTIFIGSNHNSYSSASEDDIDKNSGAPSDAGNYKLVISSKENKFNKFGYHNYTKLNISVDFTISPMTLTLSINDSVTLVEGDLGGEWSSDVIILKSTTGTGLKSGDYLAYQYSIGNVSRSKYAANLVLSSTELTLRNSSNTYINANGDEVELPEGSYQPLQDINDPDLDDSDKKVSPTYNVINITTTRSDKVETNNVWSFKWVVYNHAKPTNYNSETEKITDGYEDISRNYSITLDFDVYTHFRLIEGYEFNSVTASCNGDSKYGSVTISADITDEMLATTKKFALNDSFFDDPNHASDVVNLTAELSTATVKGTTYQLDLAQLSFATPGIHYVYYSFTKDATFEPLTGYFTVTISKVAMPITISDVTTSEYNGSPKFTKSLNGKDYIPKLIINNDPNIELTPSGVISYTIGGITINDTINVNAITIKYLKGADDLDSTVGPITAGDYTYTIEIPATDNFVKLTLSGTLNISRGQIKIVNRNTDSPYTGSYSGISKLTYGSSINDFAVNNPYYVVMVRTDVENNTFEELSSVLGEYEIRGTLITSSSAAGTYSGNNKSLAWLDPTEPTIIINNVNQTENYRVSISEASMVIAKNTFTVTNATPEYSYDGEYHGISLKISGTNTYYIYYYNKANGSYVLKSDDDALPIPQFKYKDVGTYSITYRVVDAIEEANRNFIPVENTIDLKINKTTPYIYILDDFNKEYNGQEVFIPNNFGTNSTATNIEEYVFMYEKYDSAVNEFKRMSTLIYDFTGKVDANNVPIKDWIVTDAGDSVTRPVNAGKYRMKVIIPESGNYAEKESEWKEFTISQKTISVVWGDPTKEETQIRFAYDGNHHLPNAYARTTSGDLIRLKVTADPKTSNANALLTNAGAYLAHATLDQATAFSADDNSISIDSEEFALFKNNYLISAATVYRDYSITARKLTIVINQQVKYTGTTFDFELATRDPEGNWVTEANKYKALGLLENHSIAGTLRLNKVAVRESSNPYKKFNDEFFWWRNNKLEKNIKVVDISSNDYSGNYDVSYELSIVINYSDIQFAVSGDGTFTYDPTVNGQHHIEVSIFNADKEFFKVSYSNSENGTYLTNPNSFVYQNVKAGDANNTYGFYTTWYKIEYTKEEEGYETIIGSANISIVPRDANLVFTNNEDVSKEYNGVAYNNVATFPVSCEDSTATYKYEYYKIDTNGVETSYITPTGYGPTDVGHYKVKVSLKDKSLNYKSEPIEKEFYITKRKIQIVHPLVSKEFDYKVWELELNSSNSSNYVENLANSEYLVGKLLTTSANAGTYQGINGFKWQSEYKIKNAGGTDVTHNYELTTIQITVVITKRDIKAEVIPYEGTYDGLEHGVVINIVEDEDGIKPQGAKIYYLDPDTDTYSTNEFTKKEVGLYTVSMKVEAENFNVLEIKNSTEFDSYIKINGKDASGDVVYLSATYYNGSEYPMPYYEGDSTGNQIVKFYKGADIAKITENGASATEIPCPVDAGNYCFSLVVETDGVYKQLFFKESFTILPKEISKDDLIWEDLTQTYTGEALEPKAYYYDTNNIKVYASSITGIPQTVVGNYPVSASISDTNYKLLDSNETFVITKKPILSPVFDENQLLTTYDEKFVIVDTSGRTYLRTSTGTVAMIVPTNASIYQLEDYTVVVDATDTYVLTDNGMLKFEGFRGQLLVTDEDGNKFLEDINGNQKLLYSAGVDPELVVEGVYQDLLDYQIFVDENLDVHEYETDEEGIFKKDENGNRIPLLDENGDQIIRQHSITLHIIDQSNYAWTNPQDSEDIEYHYEITQRVIPSGEEIINIGIDKKVFEWNEEMQVPTETVQIINKNTTQVIKTLKNGEDYKVRYMSVTKDTDGNVISEVEVLEPIEVGEYYIYIDGINNYSFESYEKKFEIVAKAPELLTIIEGVPLQFIIADTEVVGTGSSATYMVAIKENDETVERTLDNRDSTNFYLSHITTELSMENFLKQFKNDLSYIRIFKDETTDTPYTENEIKSKFIHTGAVVRLYKEEACINVSDEATCIVFGDVDRDGLIVGTDLNMIGNLMKGKIKQPTLGNGDDEISQIAYIAGMVVRSSTNSSITGVIYNEIANHMKKATINTEYTFDPKAL